MRFFRFLIFVLQFLLWSAACLAAPLSAAVYGGAGQVSGSLTILDAAGSRWMIDCGACYPDGPGTPAERQRQAVEQADRLPPGAESVAALFLTHAHADHTGRVPLLASRGFSGPIYLTEATAAICEPMLRTEARCDAGRVRRWEWSSQSRVTSETSHRMLHVHWRPCPYRQRIDVANLETATCSMQALVERFEKQPQRIRVSICQDCAADEVAAIVRQFRRVAYNVPTQIGPGLRATFVDAGHIPGSASILFEVADAGSSRRILFSGDLGNELSPLHAGPKPAPAADAVFVETTYGTTHRPPNVRDQRAAFRRAVGEATRAGGVVWIPAFALDRTQKILYELDLARSEHLLPDDLAIYCPSPGARELTEVYRAHRQDGWFRPEIARQADLWSLGEIRGTVPSPKRLPHPAVLVSTTDIVRTEWMRRMLTALLPQPSTSVFLVGYQDPAGTGKMLEEGAKSVEIDGRAVPVAARVRSFGCFSAHGDAADIDAWLAKVPRTASIVLVHGGPDELKTRAEQLRTQGWSRVSPAPPGKAIDLAK